MKQLTQKEEEIMERMWDHGPMLVFLGHKAITARCFQYFARISREEYRGGSLANVVNKFFGKSYLSAVSALVKNEKVSVEDLKELIREVEQNNQQ